MAKDEDPPKEKKVRPQNKHLRPKPWKKGQSGNPKGKPKGTKNRSTILKEMMNLIVRKIDPETGKIKNIAHPLDPDKKKMTVEEAIDSALIQKAFKGNVDAIREIKDSLYGKIKDVQEIIQPDVTRKEVEDMTDEEAAALYEQTLKRK